ncbi:tyrosine-type recombinase/integrase [Xanthobacter sp. TB0139]|uniref:tyrosine-type recombinase/integrase n=1 Tax=Xanthobacter sp. TB0139 TaxID=3459178 RepID=UPI0040398648
MPLTDTQIRKAKPTDRLYRLTDGGGLFPAVTPAGGKIWRLRYEIEGKEKTLVLGPYPDISLQEAREARVAQKRLLREGRNPAEEKKRGLRAVNIAANVTFEHLAREWHGINKGHWTPPHASDVLRSLERDVFPLLGARDVRTITVPEVLAVLRDIEARPAIETAKRVRQRMSAVFVHAIASGLADNDPAAIVERALKPLVKGRQPAITNLDLAREIIQRVDDTPAHPANKLAMRLLALTALRPGALITTPWGEFEDLDRDNPIWRVPAARMKMRKALKDDSSRDHFVPLSRQAMDAIRCLRTVTGRGPYVVPNGRSAHRPASENALGYLLNRAGYHHRHVPHGWRAAFSSVMNERFPADRHIIDLMLAHAPKDRVEGAYNRAEHMTRRAELAQEWADLLMDGQRPAAELVNGPRRASPLKMLASA